MAFETEKSVVVSSTPSRVGRLGACRHGGNGGGRGTVVEEMLHAVSQHLVRNLSSQNDMQGLEAMAQAIRWRDPSRASRSSLSLLVLLNRLLVWRCPAVCLVLVVASTHIQPPRVRSSHPFVVLYTRYVYIPV